MDSRVHVCHVQTTMNPGGLENGVVNVVNGLDPERFRSTVVCLHARGPLADRIVNPAAEVISLEHPDRLAPELPYRLARLFRKLAPNIVHTRNYTPNLYGTIGARMARVPFVVNSEHGSIQLIGWRKKLVSRALSLLADRVLCVSPALRDYLLDELRYPRGSVHVIVNGVNLDRFDSIASDPAAKRRELGIPESVWLLGTVGRFYGFKDHPAILDLLERVPEVGGRPLHAVIVGTGDEEAAFRAMTRERGLADRMHLPGFREDVHEIYRAFDLFCLLSSGNEGTSNAILEAMAAGVPVLSTEIEGNRHLIRSGENGVLVPPAGEAKLTALEREVPRLLLDAERRAAIARIAGERVRAEFRLQGMIDRYATFYRSLASGRCGFDEVPLLDPGPPKTI